MRLEGWERIADHLGVTIAAARWLRKVGLPVRKTLDGDIWTTTEALWTWKCGVAEVNEHLRARFGRPPGAALH